MDDLASPFAHLHALEARGASARMDPRRWIMARLDGRTFSQKTKGCMKPFDTRVWSAMDAAARFVMEDFQATFVYHQSDEITLLWSPAPDGVTLPFEGRRDKWLSLLASGATAAFLASLHAHGAGGMADQLPRFDARLVDDLSIGEAAGFLSWRAQDARRNALMLASITVLGHTACQGLGGREQEEALARVGRPFASMPDAFRHGTALVKRVHRLPLEADVLARIPPAHRPGPDALFERRIVEGLHLPTLVGHGDAAAFLADAHEDRLAWHAAHARA